MANQLSKEQVMLDEITRIMKEVYCIEPNDYGMDLELAGKIYNSGETAEQWCAWYAEKYGLTKLKDYNMSKATQFMNRFKK